jgi:hypothetical protein
MDAYRVSVAISMTNGVSSVLKIIQRDVLGLNKAVDLTQGKFDRLKLAVGGAAAVFAGIGMLDAFKGLAEAGGAVLDAQARMLQIGISQRDVARETAVAYQNIAVSGSTVAGNINALTTLRGILGGKNATDFSAANAALPGYTKAQFDLSSRGVDTGQLDQFVKALDIMGAFNTNGKIDPSKFGPALQEAVSAVLTTNGLLTGHGFYQAVRLSGPAASAMGEKAYLQNMVEVLLALGNRGARGLEYGATTLLGGQMSKNSAVMLDRLKLTNESDYTHEGGRWSLKSGTIAGSSQLASGDIIGWIQKYFLPAAKAQGMSPLQAAATLPQTLQLLITTISNMSPQIARSMQQQALAQTADPYAAGQKAMTGAVTDFQKALSGMWQALGTPAAAIGVTVLNDLSAGIRNFTQWVGAHPGYADAMVKVMLGLGVALTALGAAATIGAIAAMVGSGGTIALVGAGLAALAGVFYELPAAIKEVEAGFQGLEKFLGISSGPTSDAHGNNAHPGAVHSPNVPWLQSPSHLPPASAAPNVPWLRFASPPPPASAQPSQSAPHTQGKQLGEANISADQNWSKVALWIDNGAMVTISNPVDTVTVKNTGDIARGANAYAGKQLAAPNAGSTGVNLRRTPSGSAALSVPGFA